MHPAAAEEVMIKFSHTPSCVLESGVTIPRHVHAHAYATVVLEGGYQEAGECGRWNVQAGDVLLHAPFSAHWDHAPPRGARVLNLPLPIAVRRSACGRIADVELVIRLAERDSMGAADALMRGWRQAQGGLTEAPDLLARALSEPVPLGVQAWSLANGISRATAFRWFRSTYGVDPTRYRIEARARSAWRMIVNGIASLAEVSAAAGYADQAHMNRHVKAFTGRSPGAWRAHVALQPLFKTQLSDA
jgi:AraC-like DNA-binding protein